MVLSTLSQGEFCLVTVVVVSGGLLAVGGCCPALSAATLESEGPVLTSDGGGEGFRLVESAEDVDGPNGGLFFVSFKNEVLSAVGQSVDGGHLLEVLCGLPLDQ